MNYRDYLQKIIYHFIDPIINLMLKMGITPNGITAAGFVGNLIALWFFLDAAQCWNNGARNPYTLIGWGGFIILAAGLFDMMDDWLVQAIFHQSLAPYGTLRSTAIVSLSPYLAFV